MPDLTRLLTDPTGCTPEDLLSDLTHMAALGWIKGAVPTVEAIERELGRLEREGKVRLRRGVWVEAEAIEAGRLF